LWYYCFGSAAPACKRFSSHGLSVSEGFKLDIYIIINKTSFRVSRLHKFTFNAGFAVYWIHFQQARFLLSTVLSIYYYILRTRVYPDTVFTCVYPRSTVASCVCITSLHTGILLYTGFTFEVSKHQSYYYIYLRVCTVFDTAQQDRPLRLSTA
jgi:hypothetical protein